RARRARAHLRRRAFLARRRWRRSRHEYRPSRTGSIARRRSLGANAPAAARSPLECSWAGPLRDSHNEAGPRQTSVDQVAEVLDLFPERRLIVALAHAVVPQLVPLEFFQ